MEGLEQPDEAQQARQPKDAQRGDHDPAAREGQEAAHQHGHDRHRHDEEVEERPGVTDHAPESLRVEEPAGQPLHGEDTEEADLEILRQFLYISLSLSLSLYIYIYI